MLNKRVRERGENEGEGYVNKKKVIMTHIENELKYFLSELNSKKMFSFFKLK